jgi:D-glycero-D-manno-heptose 1,7-bisphosphate phosphatase
MFFCPYLKDAEVDRFKCDSLLRKPNPGMILKALAKYNISMNDSFMIGDKDSDMINLPYLCSYLVQGGYKISRHNRVCRDFSELYKLIHDDKIKKSESHTGEDL